MGMVVHSLLRGRLGAIAVRGRIERRAAIGNVIRLGRAEADAIVEGLWGSGAPQPPVTFRDPDRMPPGAAKGDAP